MKKCEFLKEKEIAEILGIPSATVRTWRYRERGPSYVKAEGKKGAVLYPIVDFEKWLESRFIIL